MGDGEGGRVRDGNADEDDDGKHAEAAAALIR